MPEPTSEPDDLQELDPELEPDPDADHHARPTPSHAALVFAGGFLGVLARAALLDAAPSPPGAFPWTLAALNLAGSAVLALLVVRVLDPRPHEVGLRLLLATGLVGGFTTYSSLVSVAIVAGHRGHVGVAVATLLGTSVGGALLAMACTRAARVARR